MKKWIKDKLWPFLQKWGGKIIAVLALLFLIDKTKDFIYNAVFGKVPEGSRHFKRIPGDRNKILVRKDGKWEYVDLTKLDGEVTADKVMAAAHDPDTNKFIVELNHEKTNHTVDPNYDRSPGDSSD